MKGNNKKRAKRLKKQVIKRDDKGRLLPGSILNPAGKPPSIYEIKSEIAHRTKDLNKLLDFIVGVVEDEKEKTNVKLKCAELLMAYALGRPQQLIDVQEKSINININRDDITSQDDSMYTIDIEDL